MSLSRRRAIACLSALSAIRLFALCVIAAGVLSTAAQAHDFQLKSLKIHHPFARATPPGATSAGAFMRIENQGKDADRLLRVASPAAGIVELHEMRMDGGVMKMRSVTGIEIKPGATVALQPGGYHVMLQGLKGPLQQGQDFPMTLIFEKAGSIDVVVRIQAMGATAHEH